jgi:hypothetical protein
MSKMGSHDPFEYLKHKLYSQKNNQESNYQFDFRPLKVGNCLDLLLCKWHDTYLLENTRRGLQLCLQPHFNRRSSLEVMGFQSCGSPNFGNFETPKLGVMGQNDIWV